MPALIGMTRAFRCSSRISVTQTCSGCVPPLAGRARRARAQRRWCAQRRSDRHTDAHYVRSTRRVHGVVAEDLASVGERHDPGITLLMPGFWKMNMNQIGATLERAIQVMRSAPRLSLPCHRLIGCASTTTMSSTTGWRCCQWMKSSISCAVSWSYADGHSGRDILGYTRSRQPSAPGSEHTNRRPALAGADVGLLLRNLVAGDYTARCLPRSARLARLWAGAKTSTCSRAVLMPRASGR